MIPLELKSAFWSSVQYANSLESSFHVCLLCVMIAINTLPYCSLIPCSLIASTDQAAYFHPFPSHSMRVRMCLSMPLLYALSVFVGGHGEVIEMSGWDCV